MSDFQNTEAEQVAVDDGVQDALPEDARWHRREARKLLIGKSGMTDSQKIESLSAAMGHLKSALALMEAKNK